MIASYIAYIRNVRRYSENTVRIYTAVLEEFAEYSCGESADDAALLAALDLTAIRNYEIHLLDEKAASPRTVHLHLSVLSGFCRYLVRQGRIEANPVRLVKRPKMRRRLPEFFKEEAMEAYFRETAPALTEENLALMAGGGTVAASVYRSRLCRLIVSLLYQTGIRRSELIALDVGAADFSRKVLRVRGKGGKMREIPLGASLCREISLYLQSTAILIGRERMREEPLLLTPSGRRLYPGFVDKAVKTELGAVPGVTGRKSPHVLRHTLATELLDKGADLNSIKELLGHSSLAATQVYTHSSVEKLKSVYKNAHPRAKTGGKHGD